jgi:hypothetical protein
MGQQMSSRLNRIQLKIWEKSFDNISGLKAAEAEKSLQ